MRQTALREIHRLARENSEVIFIGSDLGYKTLEQFAQELPQQFYMEGISEAHIIGMAAGLAMEGNIVYINTIASFLTRRCLEQILLNLCLEKQKVRLLGSGGGMVYGPLGPTHTTCDDIALMRALPHMTTVVPADANQMQQTIEASLNYDGPLYIRFAKGGDPLIENNLPFQLGKAQVLIKPDNFEVLLIATGIMVKKAYDIAQKLLKENIHCAVVNVHTLKPLDKETLTPLLASANKVITLEEHGPIGGLGSAIAEIIAQDKNVQAKLEKISLPDDFPEIYGRQENILEHYKLDTQNLYQRIYESTLQ